MQNFKIKEERFASDSLANALLDSSLIPQTDKLQYNIKLINCNNCIQIYEYEEMRTKKNPNIEKNLKFQKIKINISTKGKNLYHPIRSDNALRSKLSLERLVKCNENEFKSFLTLTFAENIINIQESNKQFNIWRTKVKKEFPNFKYVCVPEYQKRGAVHYHLITNLEVNSLLLPLQKNKHKQYDVFYWNYGFTSAFPIEDINVVSYMSKYMTKNIDNRLYGRKRYFYSKNLILPKQEFLNFNNDKIKEYIYNLLKNKNMNYSNSYLNKYTSEIINFKEFKTSNHY